MRRYIMRVGLLSLGGVLLIVACGGGGTDPGGGGGGGGGGTLVHAKRVTAGTGTVFTPDVQTIPANDTIYFTFSSVQHSVHFTTAGSPADVGLSTNLTAKRVFPTAGTFNYFCTVHGTSMSGQIVVQ
jgi:plastocyanin